MFRKADPIHKAYERHRGRQELLQFHVAKQVGLGAQQVSVRVARRRLALLIAAHRIFAPGKKALRKGQFAVGPA